MKGFFRLLLGAQILCVIIIVMFFIAGALMALACTLVALGLLTGLLVLLKALFRRSGT